MITEITVDVSFLKHTLKVSDSHIVEGDYNTAKLSFNFEEDVFASEGDVLFKMSNPQGELIYLDNLKHPEAHTEICLVGYDENGVMGSLFNTYGLYPFELVWYADDGKLTSAPGWLNVAKRQVTVEENTIASQFPWFKYLSQINHSIFVRYSAYADGTDFTDTWSEDTYYMGVATASSAPEDKSKYEWMFIGRSEDGAIFFPSVSEEGVLSWTNNKGLENPEPVDIWGKQGHISTLKTINGRVLRFFVGSKEEYEALTAEDKQNLFALFTDDTAKEEIENSIKALQTQINTAYSSLKADAALFESNVITEDGLYCVHCSMPEEDFTAMMFIHAGKLQNYEQQGYLLYFNGSSFELHYSEDYEMVGDVEYTIYQIIR